MAETMMAGIHESRECTDALDDEGYVLALATTGKVAKCAAGGKAFGVNQKSTKHPITGTAEANKEVAIVKMGSKAKVQYAVQSTENDIAIGDIVSVKATSVSGCVTRHEPTAWPATWAAATAETISDEDSMIVGIALEAITAPGAGTLTGKMEVLLLCPIPIKQA